MAETNEKTTDEYSLSAAGPDATLVAPDLPYWPRDPEDFRPNIGLIACGGITQTHLTAYKAAGYNVVALCDLVEERAKKRQAEFYPDASVTTDYRDVLARPDIEVVDIATHPPERVPLIENALRAKKHVLSQKPFVLDLDTGARLADLADQMGVRFAVNQNGRWAPHFAYIREAVRAGLIGDVLSVHCGVHWDHSWVKGTPFEKIFDLVLYDFAIHWFDFASHILPDDRQITRVYATRSKAAGQTIGPPLLAQVMAEFPGGHVSLVFDASLKYGQQDRTLVGGTQGTLVSTGPNLGEQTLTLFTQKGRATPTLSGNWFPDGFHGTMGELLTSIEQNRTPLNNARDNLRSLAFCFAAIASANDGVPKTVGEVRRLPAGSAPAATTPPPTAAGAGK